MVILAPAQAGVGRDGVVVGSFLTDLEVDAPILMYLTMLLRLDTKVYSICIVDRKSEHRSLGHRLDPWSLVGPHSSSSVSVNGVDAYLGSIHNVYRSVLYQALPIYYPI